MRDYLLLSLIIFFSSLWAYSQSWNFNIRDEPIFIKIKPMQISKRIDITVKYEKYGSYLVLDLFEKKARASCSGISFQSPEYSEICKLPIGTKIQATNVRFLDFSSPRLDGILLSGIFIINSNKTVKFDISNNQDAINYFLSYIRIEVWLAYAIIITSFCFSSTFLILFFLDLRRI